jgi:hypothetical protein
VLYSLDRVARLWTSQIGDLLSVDAAGHVSVDVRDVNDGVASPGLAFGLRSGEGIASKRTVGGNRWGLDFYTAFTRRMSITNGGDVTFFGHVGVLGRDPVGGLPGGWAGGLHTWDLYAEGTIGIGERGTVLAMMQNNGTIIGKQKNFVIDHPLDDRKNLVHSALEGPESAVYYRGEARLENGETVVELPAYFEELARRANRSVQVTPKFDADERVVALAASEVRDGAFRVKALTNANPTQVFYWEVKAVRADIEELEIEPTKPT